MTSDQPILQVVDLYKTYRIGFFRKRVEAVQGVSFEVMPGEIFGFIGPNGAGKTTTIKAILQLIYPSHGSILLFGEDWKSYQSRRRLGYLPETPYIYQYLKPMEFLDLCGKLAGMDKAERRKRSQALLEKVGLSHAVDRAIGKYSKGMLQRIGLAQALLHDPELLILDEPFTGLDPVGRKDVRDILLEHRQNGGTLLFTSHTLSDVEMLCDRIAIVKSGKITAHGTLDTLLEPTSRRIEIELAEVSSQLRNRLERMVDELQGGSRSLTVVVQGDEAVPTILDVSMKNGARIITIRPHRDTLEDLFMRHAK